MNTIFKKSSFYAGLAALLILLSAGITKAQTVDLSTHAGSAIAGTSLEWHSGTPATAANLLTGTAVTAAGPGTYYAFYHDLSADCYSPGSLLVVSRNICPAATADLSTHVSGTPPSGYTLEWHTALPATAANLITGAAVTAAGAGTYFAVFHDASGGCYSQTSDPVVITIASCCAAGTGAPALSASTLNNICPFVTVDLNSLHTGTTPLGASLVWFTNSAHTGTAYATPATAISGTYYAFYYDAVLTCYSPASGGVAVIIGNCHKPIAENIVNTPMNNIAAQTHIAGLIASDASGAIVDTFVIKTIPSAAQGILYTCSSNSVPCTGTYNAVFANQILTPAQAATLYFDPAKSFTGGLLFNYEARNSNGISNTASVTVPVINEAPTASSFTTAAIAAGSNAAKIPALIAADADGTITTYTVSAAPAAMGTLTYCVTPPSTGCGTAITSATVLTPAQSQSLSFAPATGYTGNASFNYTATDDNNNISTVAKVTIPVVASLFAANNLPPVTQNITADPVNSNDGTALISHLVGTDADGSISKYTITSVPAAATGTLYYCTTGTYPCTGTLTAVTGTTDLSPAQAKTLQFDPAAGNNSPAVFSYTATDDSLALSNVSTFTIPVSNQAPTAQNIAATVPKGGVNVPVPALAGNDADGTIVSINVTAVPDPATEGTLYYCSTATYPCTGTQVAVTASSVLTPAQAARVNFTPVSTYTGIASVMYTATDNNGKVSVAATAVLTIIPSISGLSPIASSSSTNLNANAGNTALATNFISATDPDGTIASYTISAIPQASQGTYFYCSTGTAPCTGTVTALTAGTNLTTAQAATLSFTPNVSYTGPSPLSFYATDNDGNKSNLTTSIVNVFNLSPVANGFTAPAVVTGGNSVSTPLTGTDPDGSVTKYTVTSIPAASLGVLTYCVTPPASGCGTSVVAGMDLTPAQAATVQFTTPTGKLTANEAPFTFTVTDNSGKLSNVATVVIPLNAPAPLPPVAQNILNAPVNNNAAQTHIAGLIASDASGAPIDNFTVLTIPAATEGVLYTCSSNSVPCTGTYTAVATGASLTPAQAASLYFDPAKTFIGTASFTYSATSVNGTSNIASVKVPVNNAAPTAISFTTGTIAAGSTANKIPALQGADADGTIASFTVNPPATGGSLTYCVTPPSTGCGTPVSGATIMTPAQAASLSFTPAVGFTGNASFLFTVTDDNGNVSTAATVTLPVTTSGATPSNIPPVTQNIVADALNSNAGQSLIAPLVGTDADGIVTKYTIATIPAASTGTLYYCTTGNYPCTGTLTAVTGVQDLTPAQAGSLQFDPAAGNNNPASFTYTATDNKAAVSNVSTFTLPVKNDPPTAQNIVAVVPKDGVNVPIPALRGNDADGTITTVNVTSVPNPATEGTLYYCSTATTPCTGTQVALTAAATLTPQQAATVNFTPVSNYLGTAVATYTVTDNNGKISEPATVSLTVNTASAGLPPVAAAKDTSLNANAGNTALGAGFIKAADADGSITAYTITAIPQAAEGVYYYCSTGTAPCTGTVTAITAGTTLTTAQAATVSFTPNVSYTGPSPLSFYATDNDGNSSNVATSVVNVFNLSPVAKGFTAPSAKTGGAGVSTPLTATDPDGTISKYTVTTVPAASLGTLTYCVTPPSTGCGTVITAGTDLTPAQAATVSFKAAAGAVLANEIPFTFTATDNSGQLSNVATVVIPMNANAVPVAQNIVAAAINNNASQSAIPALSASDPSGAPIDNYTIKTLPAAAQGILYTCSSNSVPCTGTYTAVTANQVLSPAQSAALYFDPAKTFVGTASFTYDAKSVNGPSNTAIVSIPVYNNAPTAASFTTGRAARDSADIKLPPLQGADGDGTVVSVTVTPPPASTGFLTYCTAPPSGGCGTVITGTIVLTPEQASNLSYTTAPGYTGNTVFTYTVTDDNGNVSEPAAVTIPVTPWSLYSGNIAPVTQNVTTAPFSGNEGKTLLPPLVGTDPDGTVAKYTIESIPAASAGTLYYCTTGNYPCTGTLNPITGVLDLSPSQAATLQFDPAPDNNLPAVFTYSVTDDQAAVSNISSVKIPFVNLPPVAQNTTPTVPEGATNFPIPGIKGTDVDGIVEKVTVVTVPNGTTEGTLYYCSTGTTPCTGTQVPVTPLTELTPEQASTVNFTPVPGYTGTAVATYNVTDNNGNVSDPATITIIINTSNASGTPPTAKGSDVSLNANSGNTSLGSSFISGSDADGTIASFTIAGVPSSNQGVYYYCSTGIAPCSGTATAIVAGTVLTPAQAATLSFTPNANYQGPSPISFTVTDNDGNTSNMATSLVNVFSEAPVANGFTAPAVMMAGSPVSTPLTAVDPDGTIVTIIVTSVPSDSFGKLTYCVSPGSCGIPVTVGTELTPAQALTVVFTPEVKIRVNEILFTFEAIDNSGILSNVATVVIPVSSAVNLPILLISFDAVQKDCEAIVSWTTGVESGVTGFEVMKSVDDARTFSSLGFIKAKGSNSAYNFTVANTTNSYFRLKINEASGKYTYSKTLKVFADCKHNLLKVYPNPAQDQLFIELKGTGDYNAYQLKTLLGQVMLSGSFKANIVHSIQLGNMANGTYLLVITTENGVETQRIEVIR